MSKNEVCRGFRQSVMNRREALTAGALSLGGLSLAPFLQLKARAAQDVPSISRTPGRAKSCILIFQWGGPSQLETWDLKPEAPDGIRGSFQPIETSVPGIWISEHFPKLAQRAHHLSIIRSMTHDDVAHLSSVHRMQTGHLAPRPKSDADGPSPIDSPHLGSVVARVTPRRGALPASVLMPWIVSHPAAPGGKAPGQHGGWLGKAFDPFLVEGDPSQPDFQVQGLGLPDGLGPDRLASRRRLLGEFSEGSPASLPGRSARSWDGFMSQAMDALDSAEARGAFDLSQETPQTRDMYGRHIHGQCLLMARRLVEHGVSLVTVNWHNDGRNFWDTHGDNFNRLKNDLMPPADQGFAALLDDLQSRGLLDDTLVVWVGEFGRNPKITVANAGREHWARCYSAALAGGGIRGGQIYGASDRWAGEPALNPVSPEDLSATILHALGIDPASMLMDPLGRPLRLAAGEPVVDLFA